MSHVLPNGYPNLMAFWYKTFGGNDAFPFFKVETFLPLIVFAGTDFLLPENSSVFVKAGLSFAKARQWPAALRYELARSQDDSTWTRVGEVVGLGNSTGRGSYNFTDNHAGSGKQLYRLSAVEAGGTVKLSNIVIIKETKTTTTSVGGLFSNPVRSTLNLVLNVPAKELITVSLP